MTVIAGTPDCATPASISYRVFRNLIYDNPWQPSASPVAVGALCCPRTPNGIGYQCTAITTGITGGSEPTWPLVLTNTVVDGGVTWTAKDVANPSGRGGTNIHPTVQFGFNWTSAALDALRIIAWDIAKGIVDSANTEKWDGTSQVSGGGGSSSIITYNLDFTAQTTQDFKAGGDGTYTVDGNSWSVTGTAFCSTFKLLNGTGLQIVMNGNGSASFFTPFQTISALAATIPGITHGYACYFRVSSNSTPNANGAASWVAIFGKDASAGVWATLVGQTGNAIQCSQHYNAGAGHGFTFGSLTDDVWVVAVPKDFLWSNYFTGVFAGGSFSSTTIKMRGAASMWDHAATQGASIQGGGTIPDLSTQAPMIQGFSNGGSFVSMTVSHMRIVAAP